ncbi:MAG: ribosomal protein S18-alanine N-acetyltransferase [Thermoanaerobaculia bacterium]|nr:ribosomal protein S18-alanine N-acetyltransferase [Thermoanaerobaculia bacterium]
MSAVIRPARVGDLDGLAAIEAIAFPDPWNQSLLAAELSHPAAIVLLAETEDGRIVAYASFRDVAGEAELFRVATTPEARRRGLARQLLAEGLEALTRRGVSLCHLEVRADNHAALELYSSLGFRPVGRRARYYGEVDALLLCRPFG